MKHKFIIPTLIFCLIAVFSFSQEIKKLSPIEFESKLKSEKNYQLVDVRTKKEFEEGHMKDALNIDYNGPDFQKMISALDATNPTYVYCLSGGRSGEAAKILNEKGFKAVYNLDGGMKKWKEAGKPFEASVAKGKGISKIEFEGLLKTNTLTLVDFGAKWCAPCKKMAPTIESLSKDQKLNIKVVKIDIDENESLSRELKIEGLPTLQLYKNKKLIWQQEGFMEEAELRKIIVDKL